MEPRVCLVAMPWPTINEPSLGLSILKSQLAAEGIQARVYHAYLDLLQHITYATYSFISRCWGLNEFVFSGVLDPQPDAKQLVCLVHEAAERIRQEHPYHPKYADLRSLVELILTLREEIIPRYLEECAQAIVREQPTLVGFTCMFDQTVASLALARLIKQQCPDVLVAFGGYAIEGPPAQQIVRAFPWVDCVAKGDGEPVVGALARASVGDGQLAAIPGVITRDAEATLATPPRRLPMDASPDPDYDDWFADVEKLRAQAAIEVRTSVLPVESSRGCWYGQSQHCVFCGIDDDTLRYRSKSPQRVLDMLAALRTKYGDYNFRFNDYILPAPYYIKLLPELTKIRPRYQLQCEIKANQKAARLALFSEAGFTELQPGIESFSPHVLQLMNKGVRAIQNVSTIKNGYVNRIVIHYNVLFGIPGETPADYLEMLTVLPRLYHLQPPFSRCETEITRFAPLQNDPQRFGIQLPQPKSRHADLYDVIFSDAFLQRSGFDLDDYAYYFKRPFQWSDDLSELYAQLVVQVNHWKAQHLREEVFLGYRADESGMTFLDSRFGPVQSIPIDALTAAVYLACDTEPVSIEAIVEALSATREQVERALTLLDHHRLIWREDDDVLGLGVPMAIVESHLASRWRQKWTSLYALSPKAQALDDELAAVVA